MLCSNLNSSWEFNRGLNSSMAEGFQGTHAKKEVVDLPHDAMIGAQRHLQAVSGASGGFFETGNCEYTKVITWSKENAQKVAYLEFDGIYTNASVLVNGDYVGGCHNGYGNFWLKVNDFLLPGQDNKIKVIVKNSMQPNGRWYTGEGIYRNVNLWTANALHIVPEGVRVTTVSADEKVAVLEIQTQIQWEGSGSKTGYIETKIEDADGYNVCSRAHFCVKSGETITVWQKIYVENPRLWSICHPNLYQCSSVIVTGEETEDVHQTTFGIRVLQLDTKYGLRINGETIKLKGGCIHHDNGILGAVSLYDAEMRRVSMLKRAGYNALRGAHNQMSKVLLEVCDRVGMIVMEEFTDAWTHPKMDYDYGFFFPMAWESDLEQMIRRDYNHPSVVMYSIGNEIPETGSAKAANWGRKLTDKIRNLDHTRYITNGINIMMSVIDRIGVIAGDIGMNLAKKGYSPTEINNLMNNTAEMMAQVVVHPMAEDATAESFDMLDIIGLNYAEEVAVEQHEKYPHRIFLGSETLPGNLDKNWKLVQNNAHIIGDFSWTAWDYLGEAGIGRIEETDQDLSGMQGFMGEYPWLAAWTGDFDITGFRRPVSYWRETIWTGRNHQPYISVHNPMNIGKKMFCGNWSWTDSLHSWNWPEADGMKTFVEVYTDAEEVELVVNSVILGRKKAGIEQKENYCRWEVIYEPGYVEAIAYIEGHEVGREILYTPENASVNMASDRQVLHVDSDELAYVEIELRDARGTLQMAEDQQLWVETEGPVKLLACGSADPKTEEKYTSSNHKTYQGRMLVIVKAEKTTGTGKISVKDKNGQETAIEISIIEKEK